MEWMHSSIILNYYFYLQSSGSWNQATFALAAPCFKQSLVQTRKSSQRTWSSAGIICGQWTFFFYISRTFVFKMNFLNSRWKFENAFLRKQIKPKFLVWTVRLQSQFVSLPWHWRAEGKVHAICKQCFINFHCVNMFMTQNCWKGYWWIRSWKNGRSPSGRIRQRALPRKFNQHRSGVWR